MPLPRDGSVTRPNEIAKKRGRALVTLTRLDRQRALDDMDERHRHIRPQRQQRRSDVRASCLRVLDGVDGAALVGIAPAHEVIQQHADAVDVAGRRRRRAAQGLRRAVERRPHRGCLVVARTLRQPGAEVHQDDPPGVLADDVAGLDVAMHEPVGVDDCQRAAHVLDDHGRLAIVHRALRRDHRIHRLAAEELHDEAEPALVLLDVQHADDVGMRDLGKRTPLAQQALGQLAVAVTAMQDLDRDRHLEHGIPGAIDAAESAAPDLLVEAIAPPRRKRVVVCACRGRRAGTSLAVQEIAGLQLRMHDPDLVERAQERQLAQVLVRQRAGDRGSRVQASQSTASRSATRRRTSSSSASSDMASLFGQPLHRAVHGDARRAGGRLAEVAREVLVVVREFEASDDGFAIHGVEPLQGGFVALRRSTPIRRSSGDVSSAGSDGPAVVSKSTTVGAAPVRRDLVRIACRR